MRRRHSAGVWEIFIPRLTAGERFFFVFVGFVGVVLQLKADPLARATEHPPANASIVPEPWHYHWNDGDWLARRAAAQAPSAPISIYEVHVASWLRPEHGETIDWRGGARGRGPGGGARGGARGGGRPGGGRPGG